jgi:hypothetical protein
MIAFPEIPKPPKVFEIAAVPSGVVMDHATIARLWTAYNHLMRKLTEEEARGVIEDGVLNVCEDSPDAKTTVTIGDAKDWPEGPELDAFWIDELKDFGDLK